MDVTELSSQAASGMTDEGRRARPGRVASR